jgi:hypothetical protein
LFIIMYKLFTHRFILVGFLYATSYFNFYFIWLL